MPISLEEFINFFINIPKAKKDSIDKIYSILEECTQNKKTLKSIEWKNLSLKALQHSFKISFIAPYK